MRIIAILLLTNLSIISLWSQHYYPLESKGKLPKDFVISPIQKYKNLTSNISDLARKRGRVTEERFYLKSSFVIDDLLKSGKVLFNDPVTKYINEVADQLLAHDLPLRNKIRFYAVRSASVNAFATHEGIIFVNLGLLARLDNEAQLAFILAHEITHFKEKHALNLFANSERHAHNKGGFLRDKHLEKELLSKQQFSQELELDADRKGFVLFEKSNYSTKDLGSLFHALALTHQPYGNAPFSKAFFETEFLKFPNRFFLEEVSPYSATIETSNKNSSHPDIIQRQEKLNSYIEKEDLNKKNFLVAAPLFYKLREKTRYELSYLYLNEGNYYNAIFNAYMILNEGKESLYLRKCVAKALQSFVYFRNSKHTNKVEIHHNYVAGNVQQLHYFINSLKNDELNVLALGYAWKLYKNNMEDVELKGIVQGLFQQMVYFHFDKLEVFYQNAPNFDNSVISANLKPSNNKLWEKEFIKYAFVDYLKDPEFINFFKKSKRQKFVKKREEAFAETKRGQSIKRYESKKRLENGYALGINKIVLVNPHYIKYDSRKVNNQKLFVESESARQSFRKKLWKNAQIAELQASILDVKNLRTQDAQKYNDISILNEWFDQQLDFDYFDMQSFNQDRVNKIAKKYGTDYFVWMGVVNKRENKNLLNSLTEFYTPYNGLYNLLTPKYESLFFAVVYDVRNYDLKMVKMEMIKQKDHDSIINAHIYDTFIQIKQKKD